MGFIELASVVKQYHMGEVTIPALDGVSFEIEEGELCMIVGPSGAGKTTVLNILGGIDGCDGGTVKIDGEMINTFSRRQLSLYRRQNVGFVFQFYNLVPNLTALENVELSASLTKKALAPKRMLERVGLSKNVTVLGANNHAEFWDSEEWAALRDAEASPENIAAVMQELDF